MKRLIAGLLGALALVSNPAVAGNNASYGQHGMALFGGRDALYVSHLPMFHAPHDTQVVLQVHLADPAQDAALRRRLDAKTTLWTASPENFELDRLAPGTHRPLEQFKADLVLGHFEQGGKTEYKGATVIVDKVLMYRRLNPAVRRSAVARYVQLGAGKRRFLLKEIDSRPDFEHIVAIDAAAGTPTQAFSVAKQALAETPAASLQRGLPGASVTGTVYFYTADLK